MGSTNNSSSESLHQAKFFLSKLKILFFLPLNFLLSSSSSSSSACRHPLLDVGLFYLFPQISASGCQHPIPSYNLLNVVSPSQLGSTHISFYGSWSPLDYPFWPSWIVLPCHVLQHIGNPTASSDDLVSHPVSKANPHHCPLHGFLAYSQLVCFRLRKC